MLLNVVIDIALVLIVVIGAIIGLKRGFISTVARPVKFFACLIISFSLAAPLSTGVIEPMVGESVQNQMEDYLVDKIAADDDGEIELPTLVRIAASLLDIDIDGLENTEDYAEALVERIASPIIHLLGVIISFVILYFASKLVLGLLLKILNSMFNSGVAGALNKTLGLVFNTVFSVIIAWCAVCVLSFVLNTSLCQSIEFVSEFDGGFVYNFFKNMSPLDLLLSF